MNNESSLTLTDTTSSQQMKIVQIGDVHIGHPKLNVTNCQYALNEMMRTHLKTADYLFVTGDLFDRMLTFENRSTQLVLDAWRKIYMYSLRNRKLQARLLRGTYSHDRCQGSSIFELWNNANLCFDYIDTVRIEVSNVSVLYLPDSLPQQNSHEVLDLVYSELDANNLKQVDFVVGHGYFDHVLPYGALHRPKIVYTYEQFRPIVKHKVLMGHVHTHSVYKDFIYYNGSFDRLNHGEEEPKGYYIHEGTLATGFVSTFVVNELTTPFVTIVIPDVMTDMSLMTSYCERAIDKKILATSMSGHVRIQTTDNATTEMVVAVLQTRYAQNVVSVTAYKNKRDTGLVDVSLLECDDFTVRNDNVAECVYTYLSMNRPECALPLETVSEIINAHMNV